MSFLSSATSLFSSDNSKSVSDASGSSISTTPPSPSTQSDASGNIFPNKDASGNPINSTLIEYNQYIIFGIHLIFLIIILFVWGVLTSNLLSLITAPRAVKNYFFPSEKYDQPYCNSNKDAFFYKHSFPYTAVESICETPESNAKRVLYNASYNDLFASTDPGGIGIGPTLAKAGQEWFYNINYYTYSNIRGIIKSSLEFPNVEPSGGESKRGSVDTINEMREDKTRMFFILLGTPIYYYLFLYYILSFLVLALTVCSGFYNGGKILWGILFTGMTFIFLIPIIMGVINAVYTLLTNIYIFILYPPTNNLKLKSGFKAFFQDLQPFLLTLFYLGSMYYALNDLDTVPATGICIILGFTLFRMFLNILSP